MIVMDKIGSFAVKFLSLLFAGLQRGSDDECQLYVASVRKLNFVVGD